MKKWNYKFTVPEKKKIRIIVYTDAKNEADDQFAIAHHLMTDRFIVEGFVAGHFNGNPQEYGAGHTAQASMDEVSLVLDKMGLAGEYTVVKGSELPMVDEKTPQISDGAKFIIEQAMREDDDRPLFISCLGAITDLASAILMEPKICQRMTAVWIGGGVYPEGTGEFNMEQDIAAANVLFCSDMPVWQIPRNTYKQVSVTLGILQDRVEPCGEFGKYLFDQLVAYNDKTAERMDWPHGETWGLGVRVITGSPALPRGSFGWSGAYGTHFWVDPTNRITAIYMKNSRYDGGSGAQTARRFEQAVMASFAD